MNMPKSIPNNLNIDKIIMPKNIELNKEESNFQKLLNKKNNSNNKLDNNIIVMEDFFDISINNYKTFNELSRKKGNGYKIPNYKFIEDKLEGLDSGLYLFAGESNGGKSAAMMNILKDVCSYEDNNLFGIYYSLDDNKNEIIPRIIAMEQSIPIGVAAKPKRYEDLLNNTESFGDNEALYRDYLAKREIGLNKLIDEANKFLIEDTNKIKNSSDIVNHIKMVKTFLKSFYIEQGNVEKAHKMNVIIAIDALNDIKLDPKVYGRIRKEEAAEEIAKFAKDLSNDFNIPVFASSHLRKLNGNRRPTVDDLREANTLVYEASVIWLVYNDVSKNKEGAKIYWNDNQKPGPIIELDWAKNKKSSYKGRSFYKFKPNFSQIKECSIKEMEAFENLIIQS